MEASSYSARRRTARAKGEWNGWVSPEHARRRLTDLESAGLGIRRVAELAGISPATVQRIKAGQGHIRAHVERALLELTPSLAHGALASGKASYTAKQLLNGLRAEGYATKEIASRLGLRSKTLQYDADQIRVRSVVRIRSLHHQLVVKERL